MFLVIIIIMGHFGQVTQVVMCVYGNHTSCFGNRFKELSYFLKMIFIHFIFFLSRCRSWDWHDKERISAGSQSQTQNVRYQLFVVPECLGTPSSQHNDLEWRAHVREDTTLTYFPVIILDYTGILESRFSFGCTFISNLEAAIVLNFSVAFIYFRDNTPWWSQGNMSLCFWWLLASCWTTAPKVLRSRAELRVRWCQVGGQQGQRAWGCLLARWHHWRAGRG